MINRMKIKIRLQREQVLQVEQYKSTFLKPTGLVARQGKSIYISPDFHKRISRIVFILGDGKITLSDYLHNVLKHHFENFSDEIKIISVDKQEPII
ncbi:Protein of unknown function [Porphyromonadaceae bacterium KH3R12]|nr:Protein of unknown function [Porphyromonadaceae bacterium KH3R12]